MATSSKRPISPISRLYAQANIMTYRQQLDRSLVDCAQTANAYLEVVSRLGQYHEHVVPTREAWERAETSYEALLKQAGTGETAPGVKRQEEASGSI